MRHIRPLLSFLLSLSACTHESTTQKNLKTPPIETALNSKFSAFAPDEVSAPALAPTRLPLHAKKIFVPPAPVVERRLYSDKVEASSFLWTNWNRFQENYHPNYIMDGDPKTAWVQGVSGSGAGESIKIHVSEVAKTTKLRVKIKSGYQKSKGLFAQNARPKTIELIAYPSKEKKSITLKPTKPSPAPSAQEIEQQLARLFCMTPYWCIESWLYQNTAVAIQLCTEQYNGRDVALFTEWAADRKLLDEVKQSKDACYRKKQRHDQREVRRVGLLLGGEGISSRATATHPRSKNAGAPAPAGERLC
jgi:hypothetical protein